MTPSEAQWLRVHKYLGRDRYTLAVQAAADYPESLRLAGTPLLSPPAWRLPAPVPLADLSLEFRPQAPAPPPPDVASLVPQALPERRDGTRYARFSDVIEALAVPAIFANRPTYRLIEADLAGSASPRLVFGRGRFFDGVDVGGPAGHEYAAARLGLAGACPYRAAIAGPGGVPANRAVLATSALTLRYDRAAGTATFPLHHRDAARVSHAGGLYQVIPVGVFQPSGEAPWNEANDFDLWRGLLREYAEELLGATEDYGSELAPIDYAAWPLARAMAAGLADGRVRAYCLGLGADPLTFAVDLLAAVVIDAPLYDDLFGGLVAANAEGRVIAPRPLTEPTVRELLATAPLQAAAAALLSLALAHCNQLLTGLQQHAGTGEGRREGGAKDYQPARGHDLLICVRVIRVSSEDDMIALFLLDPCHDAWPWRKPGRLRELPRPLERAIRRQSPRIGRRTAGSPGNQSVRRLQQSLLAHRPCRRARRAFPAPDPCRTAYALAGFPNEVECLVGTARTMDRWDH